MGYWGIWHMGGGKYRIKVYVHVEPRKLGVVTATIRNRRHKVLVSIAEDTLLRTVVTLSVLCFGSIIRLALYTVYILCCWESPLLR
jgi:hypothetical protein